MESIKYNVFVISATNIERGWANINACNCGYCVIESPNCAVLIHIGQIFHDCADERLEICPNLTTDSQNVVMIKRPF